MALAVALALAAIPVSARNTEVLLKSNPSGATVAELSEGYLGTTHTTAVFKRGKVLTFVFTMEGYREQRVKRKLKGRWMEIGVDLDPIPGTPLEVNLKPAHARFRVLSKDGETLFEGKSGDINQLEDALWLAKGAPDFVVESFAPGYETYRALVRIEQHQRRTLSYVLAGQKTVLEVATDPLGARVQERSLGFLGTTPFKRSLELEDLIRRGLVLEPETDARATLVLTVSKKGYETAIREVVLDLARPSTEVRLVLGPSGGGSRP